MNLNSSTTTEATANESTLYLYIMQGLQGINRKSVHFHFTLQNNDVYTQELHTRTINDQSFWFESEKEMGSQPWTSSFRRLPRKESTCSAQRLRVHIAAGMREYEYNQKNVYIRVHNMKEYRIDQRHKSKQTKKSYKIPAAWLFVQFPSRGDGCHSSGSGQSNRMEDSKNSTHQQGKEHERLSSPQAPKIVYTCQKPHVKQSRICSTTIWKRAIKYQTVQKRRTRLTWVLLGGDTGVSGGGGVACRVTGSTLLARLSCSRASHAWSMLPNEERSSASWNSSSSQSLVYNSVNYINQRFSRSQCVTVIQTSQTRIMLKWKW